ncbi:hypothetical protein PMAYCL1PPCAC_08687, partial [Pristionchus mayeri]
TPIEPYHGEITSLIVTHEPMIELETDFTLFQVDDGTIFYWYHNPGKLYVKYKEEYIYADLPVIQIYCILAHLNTVYFLALPKRVTLKFTQYFPTIF